MVPIRLVCWWLVIALLPGGMPPALAHGGVDLAPSGLPGEFYIGQATTTGFDTRYRADGMARALRKVLVRVSGDPALAHDPRVTALVPDTKALIHLYSYRDEMAGIPRHDEQGTYDRPYLMTVAFDPGKIDALLAKLGEKPWLGPRPVIVPVVLVRGRDVPNTRTYLVTAREPLAANARADLARFALRYGVRIRVPSATELSAWGVGAAAFPVVDSRDGAVFAGGSATFRVATLGWVGIWRLRIGNDIRVWSVAGVELDEALDRLVSGAVAAASGHPLP
jgi:uncharacterized protein